jgi:hypothetical protein
MTTTNMDLRQLLEKTAETDFLGDMIGFTAQRLMELEVEKRVPCLTLLSVPAPESAVAQSYRIE